MSDLSADEHDVYSDLDEEKDAELDNELAVIENFEVPDLGEIPLVFEPTSIFIKNTESLSKEIFQINQLISKKVSDLTDYAIQIEENEPGANIENIESAFKEILDQTITLQCYKTRLDALKDYVRASNGKELKQVPSKKFFKETKKDIAEYFAKSEKAKYGSSEMYKSFKQSIWEVNHPEDIMPSASLGLEGASEGENSDEDVIVSRQVETLKCPITCLFFEDPVTSINCKHSFSKAAITSLLIRAHSGAIDCPVAGCTRMITSNCLEPNNQLARKLERMKSQKNREKRNDSSLEQNSNVFVLE